MEYITIQVPIKIPKPLYENGAVLVYAKVKGWNEEMAKDIEEVKDEDGNITQEAVKGISAEEYGISKIQETVREEYRAIMADMGAEQGRLQALETFNQLFGIKE